MLFEAFADRTHIPSLENVMYLATVTCTSVCTATEFPIAGNGVNLDTHRQMDAYYVLRVHNWA